MVILLDFNPVKHQHQRQHQEILVIYAGTLDIYMFAQIRTLGSVQQFQIGNIKKGIKYGFIFKCTG
jgi:hypothetical protein